MSRNISLRTGTHSRIPLPDNAQVHLTETESDLCALLDECTVWMKQERGIQTACRVAGGWVRDKVKAYALLSMLHRLICCVSVIGLS